ncbi:MAG: S41 family peptidase [Terriglobales bacterium]
MNRNRRSLRSVVLSGLLLYTYLPACGQDLKFKREEAETIVDIVAADVTKHYYDPKLHGVAFDSKLHETKLKIHNAPSLNAAFANIAAMLDSLNDSHTYFLPPPRGFALDYGWRILAIDDRCFVLRVRPDTDAATKIHPGDEVLLINGYKPSRANLFRIEYVLDTLRPQSKIEVTVRSIAGEEHNFELLPKIFSGQLASPTLGDLTKIWEVQHKSIKLRWTSLNENVLFAKIPVFAFDQDDLDKLVSAARKHKSLILDLRGNPGGLQESMTAFTGAFFGREVRIADAVRRDGTRPLTAKPNRHPFLGTLIVLVDSASNSGAELFARVVQLEKRGVVLGDQTLGRAMEAYLHPHATAGMVFATMITSADLIMADGKSLEHTGVVPDQVILPTADDIAKDRDPVLARAAELAGAKLSPEEAAKVVPHEWEQPIYVAGH